MARRPNTIPSVMLTTALPMNLHAKLTAHLYSELEQRVPFGAYQKFFCEKIQQHFGEKELDLAPYVKGASAGAFVVRGSPEAILALKYRLEAA